MTHQHTPTPWSVRWSDGPFPVLVDGNGSAVYPHDGEALAFIVRAVNAYEANQSVLEAATHYLSIGDAIEAGQEVSDYERDAAIADLRAALAYADAKTREGGQS